MNILVSGSIAYDYIMSFPGKFAEHILPENINILNVSFVVNKLERHYGGVAGNITASMGILGAKPILLGMFGSDATDYKTYLESKGVETKYAPLSQADTSSAAYIMSDEDDNQITAFYPGICTQETVVPIAQITEEAKLILISPTGKDIMLGYARAAHEKGIPVVLDLGQRLTDHTKESIQELISLSSFFISNEYELELAAEKSGWSEEEILQKTGVLITTLGKNGSRVTTKDGEKIEVPSTTPKELIDPTGAGDAYRAGFFASYVKGLSLKECAQSGNIAGLFAVEFHGTQNPEFSLETFQDRYSKVYGEDAPL